MRAGLRGAGRPGWGWGVRRGARGCGPTPSPHPRGSGGQGAGRGVALSICGEVERSGQRHCEQLRLEARTLQVPGDPAPPSPETGPRKRPGGFDKESRRKDCGGVPGPERRWPVFGSRGLGTTWGGWHCDDPVSQTGNRATERASNSPQATQRLRGKRRLPCRLLSFLQLDRLGFSACGETEPQIT